jgi:hypothetical protein
MKHPIFVAELNNKLGTPSSETIESLRLLKVFVRLSPRQRFEVVELVERLATDIITITQHVPALQLRTGRPLRRSRSRRIRPTSSLPSS